MKISTDVNDDVYWSDIAKLRDYLVHRYVKIKATEIWTDITEDIPKLKGSLLRILSEIKKD